MFVDAGIANLMRAQCGAAHIGSLWLSGARRLMSSVTFPAGILTVGLLMCVAGQAQDAPSTAKDVPPILKIGAAAPDFNLPGIDGKTHRLKEYAASKILVIAFMCDHCPVASMYEKRLKAITSDYRDRGVGVVAIMPNAPKAVHLSEMGHTDLGDTLPEMKLRAQYRNLNYPYLSDGATQAVALKYGPIATPHVFIFDQQRILRYQGRIDNNSREELVNKHEARDAIEAMLAGKPVPVEETPAMGCSTKWAYKEAGAREEIAHSEREPVTVELASMDQIKALRKNAPGRLLLVNFWATWCGPCTAEFPELQKMVRMYRKRAIDFVTVSINNPDEKAIVQKFLEEQHAINRNLLLNTTDSGEAVTAFGSGWKGGVPFTVLLDLDGKIVYHNQGEMNPLEVRRVILKNLPDDHYVGQHAYWNSTF
jgi:peroxiredoxin